MPCALEGPLFSHQRTELVTTLDAADPVAGSPFRLKCAAVGAYACQQFAETDRTEIEPPRI